MDMHQGFLRRHVVGLAQFIRVFDAFACLVSGVLALFLRFESGQLFSNAGYPALILIGALLVLVVFPLTGLYRSWRPHPLLAPTVRVLLAWVIVFAIILILLVLTKESDRFSRIWLAEWFAVQAAVLVLIRIVFFAGLHWLRSRGYNQRNVLLVGNGAKMFELIRRLTLSVSAGFVVSAIFDVKEPLAEIEGIRVRQLAQLQEYLATQTVDEVWIVVPLDQGETVRNVLRQVDGIATTVRYVPDLQDMYLLNHGITDVLGVPMIDLRASPIQGWNALIKELEDRLLAALILIVISPILLMVASGVKLTSRGPVLYRQRRNGWDGREIIVYKFRTMHLHKESPGQVTQASRDDPRLTAFGSFLRRTSLDELPQFINVLQGRMSIVGPRPHAVEHNVQYKKIIDRYMLRHVVKPGITGWAQINGLRGITDTPDKMQQRVDYDLYYINNWSLWFDLKIIAFTVFRGFVNKNAY